MVTESILVEKVIATEESRLYFQQAHARDLRMKKQTQYGGINDFDSLNGTKVLELFQEPFSNFNRKTRLQHIFQ